jgi:hypothetical protein
MAISAGMACVFSLNATVLTAAEEKAERAGASKLMRSIEKTRSQSGPFKLSGVIKRGPRTPSRFTVECEGNQYRITSGRAVAICDGNQLLCYDGRESAVVIPREQRTIDCLAFDPRALGITTGLHSDLTLGESVAYRLGRDITVASTDDASGKQDPAAVGVELTDRFGQRIRFEMQPRSPYRVYRYSKTIPRSDGDGIFTRYVTDAEYWADDATSWLPKRLVMYDQPDSDASKRGSETTVEFEKPEFVSRFDPHTWTVDGLSMPAGQPLADLRIKQRIGSWDGKKLVTP